METETQQEKLLSELNNIYFKMDELFKYIDDHKLTDYQSLLAYIDLKQIRFSLDKIHNKLR
ncbi:hypothetical protein [Heyndrickxia camelliae]|uniref:Uncharacterized protein n=1 Tax=Heyndrickxia camelliae TaxID=1707093 RepID=A0A2N3LG98_9BACI|nr:hypothetical protein [Heyndrickxia camelliae]PKR83543.1 hypothetical protein CWO92_18430 [Heyndrickxia camelliae]